MFGSYREYMHRSRKIFLYERRSERESILVICSFAKHEVRYRLPKAFRKRRGTLMLDNYSGKPEGNVLRPYEVQVIRFRTE